jgi:YKOF-related Family.
MKASVEMSMYPLDAKYGDVIIEFLERLKTYSQLKVQTNSMSTQVFGTYEDLQTIIGREMKKTFEQEEAVVMVMKWINLDLSA